jgi:hypothetical protein
MATKKKPRHDVELKPLEVPGAVLRAPKSASAKTAAEAQRDRESRREPPAGGS